ncbi:MAG: hypothetical protein KKA55_06810 [Proteobacteria bacterium]|nr:hypothetical protein [Pseudomonadota bacterium]MBU1595228.1 hypothetical protein [Pseudomonadota bacterium]
MKKFDNPSKIHTELSKRFKPKGEFETTEEFSKRIPTQQKDYVFAITSGWAGSHYDVKYDPDNNILLVALPFDGGLVHYGDNRHDMKILILSHATVNKGEWTGTTAYNAKARVKSLEIFQNELNVTNWGDVSSALAVAPSLLPKGHELRYKYSLFARLAPETAMALVHKLGVAIVAEPVTANQSGVYTYKEEDAFSATLSHPVTASIHFQGINVLVKKIILYNKADGTIITKLDISEQDN